MFVSVAVILAVCAYSKAADWQDVSWSVTGDSVSRSDFKPFTSGGSAKDGVKTDDFAAFVKGGPTADRAQKSYKIRVITPEVKQRISRRNKFQGWRMADERAPRQGSPRRFDETSSKDVRRRRPQRTYPVFIRRNDKDGSSQTTSEQYAQTIPSPDGPIAVPLPALPKGNSDDFNQVSQQIQKTIPNSDNFSKFISFPSNINSQGTTRTDSSLNAFTNAENTFPSSKVLPTVVYQLQPDPLVPSVVLADDPKPYDFGYAISDGISSSQFRHESTAGDGVVTGNYGYQDYQGIFRHVNYVADKDGFRAVMRTNEPSVVPVDSADVSVIVDPPPNVIVPKTYANNFNK